jgi:hypothetical protein
VANASAHLLEEAFFPREMRQSRGEDGVPHATSKYGFEWKILEWASKLSGAFTGSPHFPFLVLLNAAGAAERVVFGSAPETHDAQEWTSLCEGASAWLAYDPFDGPVYTYLSWDGLDQPTMERLVGSAFGPQDLTAEGLTIGFPRKWGVMF